jgi:hypothetical protein
MIILQRAYTGGRIALQPQDIRSVSESNNDITRLTYFDGFTIRDVNLSEPFDEVMALIHRSGGKVSRKPTTNTSAKKQDLEPETVVAGRAKARKK